MWALKLMDALMLAALRPWALTPDACGLGPVIVDAMVLASADCDR